MLTYLLSCGFILGAYQYLCILIRVLILIDAIIV